MHPFDISVLQCTSLRIKKSKYESSKSIRQQYDSCESIWKQPLVIPITDMRIVAMLFIRECAGGDERQRASPTDRSSVIIVTVVVVSD